VARAREQLDVGPQQRDDHELGELGAAGVLRPLGDAGRGGPVLGREPDVDLPVGGEAALMAFGTLRKDSYFNPGAVLDEATALDEAIRALAKVQFNHDEVLDDDYLAGWNAFAATWREFWAECNAWNGWIFRAENSTRDELLDLEGQYASFKATIGRLAGDGSTDGLPDVAPEGDRTIDNVTSAVSEAGGVFQKAGWQLLAGGAIIVVGLVGLIYVARRGGVPVPV
jgi:hypothetical protein